jgi:hypothetical protein
MRPLTWTGGEPVARQRARRVRRRGPEKRTIAKAWHRAPARPYYDSRANRAWLRRRGMRPRIARRGVEPSDRLGRHRYVVERSLAWLVGYRRLQVRYERHADILLAFLYLAGALICLKSVNHQSPRRPSRSAARSTPPGPPCLGACFHRHGRVWSSRACPLAR